MPVVSRLSRPHPSKSLPTPLTSAEFPDTITSLGRFVFRSMHVLWLWHSCKCYVTDMKRPHTLPEIKLKIHEVLPATFKHAGWDTWKLRQRVVLFYMLVVKWAARYTVTWTEACCLHSNCYADTWQLWVRLPCGWHSSSLRRTRPVDASLGLCPTEVLHFTCRTEHTHMSSFRFHATRWRCTNCCIQI